MKVYAVSSGSYSDYTIVAMFSTMDKAKTFALTVYDANDIEEYEIDMPYELPTYIRAHVSQSGCVTFAGEWSEFLEETLRPKWGGNAIVKVKFNQNREIMEKSAWDRLAQLKAIESGI